MNVMLFRCIYLFVCLHRWPLFRTNKGRVLQFSSYICLYVNLLTVPHFRLVLYVVDVLYHHLVDVVATCPHFIVLSRELHSFASFTDELSMTIFNAILFTSQYYLIRYVFFISSRILSVLRFSVVWFCFFHLLFFIELCCCCDMFVNSIKMRFDAVTSIENRIQQYWTNFVHKY